MHLLTNSKKSDSRTSEAWTRNAQGSLLLLNYIIHKILRLHAHKIQVRNQIKPAEVYRLYQFYAHYKINDNLNFIFYWNLSKQVKKNFDVNFQIIFKSPQATAAQNPGIVFFFRILICIYQTIFFLSSWVVMCIFNDKDLPFQHLLPGPEELCQVRGQKRNDEPPSEMALSWLLRQAHTPAWRIPGTKSGQGCAEECYPHL